MAKFFNQDVKYKGKTLGCSFEKRNVRRGTVSFHGVVHEVCPELAEEKTILVGCSSHGTVFAMTLGNVDPTNCFYLGYF